MIRNRAIFLLAVGLLAAPVCETSAEAADASFGCKVLLCAAATAPSWAGIPYCVPIMEQLFQDLARGDPWPSCEGVSTSGINYDPWLPCPDGSRAGTGDNEKYCITQVSRGDTRMTHMDGSTCARPAGETECKPYTHIDMWDYYFVDRPRRENPYFVDIYTKPSAPTRFWFQIHRYVQAD